MKARIMLVIYLISVLVGFLIFTAQETRVTRVKHANFLLKKEIAEKTLELEQYQDEDELRMSLRIDGEDHIYPEKIGIFISLDKATLVHDKLIEPIQFNVRDSVNMFKYVQTLIQYQDYIEISFNGVAFPVTSEVVGQSINYTVGGRFSTDREARDKMLRNLFMLYYRISITNDSYEYDRWLFEQQLKYTEE